MQKLRKRTAAGVAIQARQTRVRRLPPDNRRDQIIENCIQVLSEKGLTASTRDICAPIGVTQPLLYRYFSTREALIDAALERVFSHLWVSDWVARLEATQGGTVERLIAFYSPYVNTSSRAYMRLFMWCALSGNSVPQRFFVLLANRILPAVVGVLRADAGLPDLAAKPMSHGERELAMMLHTSIVFLTIRKHIYKMALPEDVGALVAMHVRASVPGMLAELARIHSGDSSDPMRIPMLAAKREVREKEVTVTRSRSQSRSQKP